MSGQHGNSIAPRGANKPMSPPTLASGQLTGAQQVFWFLWNLVTLGAPWLVKILIAKAVTEALIMHDRANPYPMYPPAPPVAPTYASEGQRGTYQP